MDEEPALMARVARGEHVQSFETLRVRKDGQLRHVSVTISPIRSASGQIIGASKIARDITERKVTEQRIRRHNHELRVLNAVTTAINEALDLQSILSRALELIVELVYVDGAECHLCAPEDRLELVAEHLLPDSFVEGSKKTPSASNAGVSGRAMETRSPVAVPDIAAEPSYVRGKLASAAGLVSLLCVPLLGRETMVGTVTLYSRARREFTEEEQTLLMIVGRELAAAVERARLFEQVQLLAITDGLTGVFNRRHFFELAELEFGTSRRYRHPGSAMMMDLDHFKALNDRYGHAVGDAALRAVVERAGKHIRHVDILGRYGGEEFTVLLPETGSDTARRVAERVRQSIAASPVDTPAGPVTVTMSIGVATAMDHVVDLATLLNDADRALYEAKQAGRNQVRFVESAPKSA